MSSFSFYESPDFLIYGSHALIAIELPAHTLGAYCVLMKTPTKMKSVKMCLFSLLFFGAFLDFTLTILLIPYLTIPAPGGIAFGLFQKLGVSNAVQTWFGAASLGLTACSVLLCFENRYSSLIVKCYSKTTAWHIKRYIYLGLNFLFALIFFVPAVYEKPDQVSAKLYIKQIVPHIPDYIIDDPTFYVIDPNTKTTMICVSAMMICQFSQDAFFVFSMLYYFLTTTSISRQTRQLQKMFFLSLCIQVSIAVGILLIPMFYIIYSMLNSYHNQVANNIITLVVSIHGLISTVVMIAIHKPYRNVIIRSATSNKNQSIVPVLRTF
ncbi:unnamed protein product [Caenorhabditis angaria]|uniref:Serpentine Receptor, class H n=1 Tax=Caenorhabditis angaria TaxID=860376 RepID=A0A9P1J1N7_9PELO|nr:unnamed protein product [Caenorhabditis angaria]